MYMAILSARKHSSTSTLLRARPTPTDFAIGSTDSYAQAGAYALPTCPLPRFAFGIAIKDRLLVHRNGKVMRTESSLSSEIEVGGCRFDLRPAESECCPLVILSSGCYLYVPPSSLNSESLI